MLRDRETEALEKLLGWLEGFEESTLFEDYTRQEGFTRAEYAGVRSVLEAAVQRQAHMSEAIQRRARLLRAPSPDMRCSGCNREVSFVYALARSEEEARQLLERGEGGVCSECMCELLIETQRALLQELFRQEETTS